MPHPLHKPHPPPLPTIRPCFTSSTSKNLHSAQKAGDVFKGLETHSTLYVLHHFTPLATLDPKEVVEILKLRPHPPVFSPLVSIPPQFMTPIKPTAEHVRVSLKPEQERDIAVFYSFLALKEVMDGLWYAIQLSHGLTDETCGKEALVEPRVARRLDMFEGEDRSEQLYQELVQDRFHRAKEYLSDLYPLHYRLEILEDIFSLLFLTSKDLKLQKNAPAEEGGNTTSGSGRSRALHLSASGLGMSSTGDGVGAGEENNNYSTSIASLTLIRSKHGFVVGEREAEGLIDLLQDCMVELSSAKFTLLSSQAPGGAAAAQGAGGDRAVAPPVPLVRCSIPPSALQQRSARLNQCIHEAKWRLQLVSTKHGVGATSNHDRCGQSLESTSSGDSLSEVSDSNEDVADPAVGGRRRKKRRKGSGKESETLGGAEGKRLSGDTEGLPTPPNLTTSQGTQMPRRPADADLSSLRGKKGLRRTSDDAQMSDVFVGSSSEQGPKEDQSPMEPPTEVAAVERMDDSGENADVEEKTATPAGGPRRKCLRSHASYSSVEKRSRRRVLSTAPIDTSKGTIVPRMLASPSSLLRTCLRHSNYLRAHEVVRLFGLTGQFSEALVQFAERYEQVCHELCSPARHGGVSSPALTPRSEPTYASRRPTPNLLSFGSASQVTGSSHLHLAIQQATRNSVALDVLHQLLAPAHVNHMLFSGDEELARKAREFGLLRAMSERVPALVMLDVVCAANVEVYLSKSIVEQASNRCQPNPGDLLPSSARSVAAKRKVSNDRKLLQFFDTSVSGPFALLRVLSDTLGVPVSLTTSAAGPFALSCSPHCLLTTFSHPITCSSITSFRAFASAYYSARDKLEHILNTTTSTTAGQEEGGGGGGGESEGRGVAEHFRELGDVLRTGCWVPWVQHGEEVGLMKRPSKCTSVPSADTTEALLGFNFMSEFTRYLSKFVELLAKLLETSNESRRGEGTGCVMWIWVGPVGGAKEWVWCGFGWGQ